MGLDYELPIYKDTDSLVLKIFECTKEFSKEYKYTIGQEMKKDALQLLWCLSVASHDITSLCDGLSVLF